MDGARSILLSITGGKDISLWEVNEAAKAVAEAAHPEANIIFGAMVDDKLEGDEVWVTVVATRYGSSQAQYGDKFGGTARTALGARPRPSDRARDMRERGERPLREPAGEPRIARRERAASGTDDLDVPEFLPRP
jgi:cell division protein FtsZ